MTPIPGSGCSSCDKSDVIDTTATDVKEIKVALLGDQYRPNGLVSQRAKDHKRIVRIERILWTAAGAGSVILFIVEVILK